MNESNRERVRGLTLVKQATTWLAAGGLAATGLFAGLAVASNSGHTGAVKRATTGSTTTTTTPPRSDQSDEGRQFQPPASPPADAGSGAAVVSGGS